MNRIIGGLALAGVFAVAATSAGASAYSMRFCGRVPDRESGMWTVTANHNTSCALARNVARDHQFSQTPMVFSPVAGRSYGFDCRRSGHTYWWNRYTCVSYNDRGMLLRVVLRVSLAP